MFSESLSRLKKEITRANALVREANMISRELATSRRQTTYDVTLQIPASNLRPCKIKVSTDKLIFSTFTNNKTSIILGSGASWVFASSVEEL